VRSGPGVNAGGIAVIERRAVGASDNTSRDAGRSRRLFSATVDCDFRERVFASMNTVFSTWVKKMI
jgi:hypothetical protein